MAEQWDRTLNEEKMIGAIYKESGGDPGKTVSMWTVGGKLGLGKAEIEDLCMGMVSEGLLEVRTLSGGVGLTGEGYERAACGAPVAADEHPLDLAEFIRRVEAEMDDLGLDPADASDLGIDLETLKGQTRRSVKLEQVVEATLLGMQHILSRSRKPELAGLTAELP